MFSWFVTKHLFLDFPLMSWAVSSFIESNLVLIFFTFQGLCSYCLLSDMMTEVHWMWCLERKISPILLNYNSRMSSAAQVLMSYAFDRSYCHLFISSFICLFIFSFVHSFVHFFFIHLVFFVVLFSPSPSSPLYFFFSYENEGNLTSTLILMADNPPWCEWCLCLEDISLRKKVSRTWSLTVYLQKLFLSQRFITETPKVTILHIFP